MAEFSRRIRTLQTVFPTSGTRVHEPNSLGDTVTPVYAFPPAADALERIRTPAAVSTPALTPGMVFGFQDNGEISVNPNGVVGTVAGDNVYTEILWGDISHDSATIRAIQFFMQTRGSPVINTAIARWESFAQIRTSGQPSGFFPIFVDSIERQSTVAGDHYVLAPHRPLILPPGWKILVVGDTAGAVWSITIQMVVIVHPLAEPPFLNP